MSSWRDFKMLPTLTDGMQLTCLQAESSHHAVQIRAVMWWLARHMCNYDKFVDDKATFGMPMIGIQEAVASTFDDCSLMWFLAPWHH